MMEFVLQITLGNEAMTDPDDIADSLTTVALTLRQGYDRYGQIMDRNGNHVGNWRMDTEEES